MEHNSSYFSQIFCPSCERIFSIDQIQTYCPDCSSPLLTKYNLVKAKQQLDRGQFAKRPKNMWRWYELLPVFNPKNIVTLGEGDSPLLQLNQLGNELGLPNLFLKDEGVNPTGSFKARGMAAAVSKAHELGIKKVILPSAGNAGGALAAYASRSGLDATIIMPKISPKTNFIESEIMGRRVILVDGLIDQAGNVASQLSQSEGYYNLSTFKEPYRVEGKKIMGYEIAESLRWVLPDAIIYPTGGGTGLIGMWKAFNELKSLGWLESNTLPRMISVQADGCAPVVEAFENNTEICKPWDNASTIATGLCVPKSFADKLILQIIRESHGTAVSVSDEEIIKWQKRLAHAEGIFSCPEGAATLAGLHKLINQQQISSDETIVVFNTASGIKYIDNLASASTPRR